MSYREATMNVTAKLSSKAQTVLPKEVRRKLGVEPGDTIRFRDTDHGIIVEKLEARPANGDGTDPFAVFTEWASPEEDEAWKDL
jgi:AbrB family looped-hinge helix DNA binding protein